MGNKVIRTSEFVTRIADKGYTKKDSAVILKDVLDVIYGAIKNGEEISLVGFGSFKAFETKPKRIRNINTGELDIAKAHMKVKFVPGITLIRAAEGHYEGLE